MNVKRALTIAKRTSLLSPYRHQIGAVVMRKGKVISTGYNKKKSHPIVCAYNPLKTLHAELDAILSCENKELLNGATMFIFRQRRDGAPALAHPCPICMEEIKKHKIRFIFYTIEEFPYWRKENV